MVDNLFLKTWTKVSKEKRSRFQILCFTRWHSIFNLMPPMATWSRSIVSLYIRGSTRWMNTISRTKIIRVRKMLSSFICVSKTKGRSFTSFNALDQVSRKVGISCLLASSKRCMVLTKSGMSFKMRWIREFWMLEKSEELVTNQCFRNMIQIILYMDKRLLLITWYINKVLQDPNLYAMKRLWIAIEIVVMRCF